MLLHLPPTPAGRYGHIDALITQLGDTGSAAWYSDEDTSRSNSIYASSEASQNETSTGTHCAPHCAADDDYACSAGDLAAARTMYDGISHSPALKCEAHAYAKEKNIRISAHLTSLVSALEPIDYSYQLLRHALLAAGIAEGASVSRKDERALDS
mmetsp:Transcript_92195/g.148860  ORF Transcript_92195/g.148860 Transcript_92195/m.148860 type:complete len:155 (+) Transcript_92195:29-493(+)